MNANLPINLHSSKNFKEMLKKLYNSRQGDRETISKGKFFAADVESIDHEVASTEWEKTRPCRRCGVGEGFLPTKASR